MSVDELSAGNFDTFAAELEVAKEKLGSENESKYCTQLEEKVTVQQNEKHQEYKKSKLDKAHQLKETDEPKNKKLTIDNETGSVWNDDSDESRVVNQVKVERVNKDETLAIELDKVEAQKSEDFLSFLHASIDTVTTVKARSDSTREQHLDATPKGNKTIDYAEIAVQKDIHDDHKSVQSVGELNTEITSVLKTEMTGIAEEVKAHFKKVEQNETRQTIEQSALEVDQKGAAKVTVDAEYSLHTVSNTSTDPRSIEKRDVINSKKASEANQRDMNSVKPKLTMESDETTESAQAIKQKLIDATVKDLNISAQVPKAENAQSSGVVTEDAKVNSVDALKHAPAIGLRVHELEQQLKVLSSSEKKQLVESIELKLVQGELTPAEQKIAQQVLSTLKQADTENIKLYVRDFSLSTSTKQGAQQAQYVGAQNTVDEAVTLESANKEHVSVNPTLSKLLESSERTLPKHDVLKSQEEQIKPSKVDGSSEVSTEEIAKTESQHKAQGGANVISSHKSDITIVNPTNAQAIGGNLAKGGGSPDASSIAKSDSNLQTGNESSFDNLIVSTPSQVTLQTASNANAEAAKLVGETGVTKSSTDTKMDDSVSKRVGANDLEVDTEKSRLAEEMKPSSLLVNANEVSAPVAKIMQTLVQIAQVSEQYNEGVAKQFMQQVEQVQQTNQTQINAQKVAIDPALLQALNIARQDAAKELQNRVSMMLNLNNKEAEIRLDPPELGSMQIRIRSDAEQAQVNFVVQNQQAKELLEQSLPKLREMLAEQGINLGESSIEQGFAGNDGKAAHDERQGQEQSKMGTDEQQNTQNARTSSKTSSSAIDYYA
ncbi:Flagellar hook-length control protein FliK [Pseudoalteromonas luteoviolacea B = ATCC 29581]|nr:Flagellar hook-length control protein FliK [Pseudoalteromonas luteoviolacea B = ATCC 29581]